MALEVRCRLNTEEGAPCRPAAACGWLSGASERKEASWRESPGFGASAQPANRTARWPAASHASPVTSRLTPLASPVNRRHSRASEAQRRQGRRSLALPQHSRRRGNSHQRRPSWGRWLCSLPPGGQQRGVLSTVSHLVPSCPPSPHLHHTTTSMTTKSTPPSPQKKQLSSSPATLLLLLSRPRCPQSKDAGK